MNTNDVLDGRVGELQIIEKGISFNFTIPIAKSGVDAEKRTVRGFATQESVDLHGEEVDFESVLKAMKFWRGNVREMHQPVAVGKAVDVVVRDDERAIEVESYISKGAESTWQKCLDGVLGYYSIGGIGDRVMGVRKDGTRGPRVIMTKWTELSLVDSGACDGAAISVVKMNDAGEPVAQLPVDGVEHAERSDAVDAADAQTASTRRAAEPNTSAVSKTAAGTVVEKGFACQSYDIETALSIFGLLNRLITNESFEGYYNSENTADNAAQVSLLRFAAQIVLDFIVTEFDEQFTDDAMAKFSDEQRALVTTLRSTVEKAGARHSKRDVTILQGMHDNSVALGAACGGSMEKATDKTPAATPAVETAVVPGTDVTKTADAAAAAAAATGTAAVEETAGVIDPAAQPVVEKAAAVVAALDAGAITDLVNKAVAAAVGSLQTELTTLKATSDSTIASLQAQVTKLSDEPANGGPVAHAGATVVEKMLAASTSDVVEGETAEVAAGVIAAIEEVAKSITNPHERESLIAKSLALRMRHGLIGQTIVPMPSQR